MESASINQLLPDLNQHERKNAPDKLFIAGDTSLLQRRPRISIIGSRMATEVGLGNAADYALQIASRGGVVVSGLALGVDSAAHRSAIKAGGKTIAVIGTPLNRFYPAENRELQALIGREHLLLSQFPPGRPTQGKDFVIRNRTMALISDASIIVEAQQKSGTMHQGWEALRLGRMLLIPKELTEASFSWPRDMVEYGAIVFESVDDLCEIIDANLPTVADGNCSIFS